MRTGNIGVLAQRRLEGRCSAQWRFVAAQFCCKGSAVCVQLVHWAMRSTLSLNVLKCSVSESSGPTCLRGPQTMLDFMWQDDLIGVAKSVNACLHKMNSLEGQISDQPGVAGRDVM